VKISEYVAQILLVLMILIIGTQVFSRYIIGRSISWAEEVAMMLMVMFGFISITIGVRKGLHLSIELFYAYFPKKLQKIFDKITDLIISLIGIAFILYGLLLTKSTMTSSMTSVHLPAATLYMIVPISGLVISYFSFTKLIGHHVKNEND
jgi:TRAP-type C4-dicarboxylate transport system permease small subunit